MAREWIHGDESANELLRRVLEEIPLFPLPHPLHRVRLRVGNIVEIVGPSSSAKTEILLQIAVNCILPKVWNGVHYGGLERSVFFLDLDCRLDIFRLSQCLKLQIIKANRLHKYDDTDLFSECMRRFSYIRCYDSFEFLASLKALHYKLAKERKADRPGADVLMIDNIGAFYWMDRGLSCLPQGGPNRKKFCLQSVLETIVQEMEKLSQLRPMFVFATKTVSLGDTYATNQMKKSNSSWASSTSSEVKNGKGFLKSTSYREYMPSIWQSYVTHRVLVRVSDDERKLQDRISYSAQWLLPYRNVLEKFAVTDAGILASS